MFSRGAIRFLVAVALSAPYPAFAAYVIEGLDGPPTANELASLKAGLKIDYHTPVQTCDAIPCGPFNVFIGNHHNNYVYGDTGGAIEGMIALYSITKDPEIADSMIFFADQVLAHRNDRYKTHNMYTGKPELCWPNKDPGPEYGYCGTENGDVLGHVTSVALELVKSPMLWNKTTPVPDTLNYGQTYLDRARAYLTECRKSIDTFIIPQLVDPMNRFRYPDSDGFGALGPRYPNLRGKTVPWNQNTMLANAFLSIAMSLEVLGEEPETVTKYDTIVKTWVRALLDTGIVKTTTMGNPTYDWCYGSSQHPPGCSEDVGHGGYDFWGVYRAFARPKYGFTMEEIVPFANTFRFLIMQSGGFAAKVDGTGTGGNVGSTWLYAAFLRHDIFPSVGAALMPAAKQGDPDTAGRLLWSKYMNARNWQPETSYGSGMMPPPERADGGIEADGGAADDAAPAVADAGGTAGSGGPGGAGGMAGAGGGNARGGAGGSTDGSGGDSGGDGTQLPAKRAAAGGCALGGTGSGGGLLVLLALIALLRRRAR
jgi:hypothetical protein